ncbi:hypothetical protein Gotri_014988 [Gossypium trilobum]|uniref:RNase H type-1 domain-containing protein n=1 Tax=Gossypium trilobum TaxID=34281 RepID=A0A7J9DZD1_9ROSI|nr:hypothetical protein [Gossypium trilobum]
MFQIEARVMLEGLHLAWNKGFWKLELECDNTLLIEIILAGGAVNSRHILRAQNTVVDLLVKIEYPELLKFHLLEEPPPSVRELLLTNSNLSALN